MTNFFATKGICEEKIVFSVSLTNYFSDLTSHEHKFQLKLHSHILKFQV